MAAIPDRPISFEVFSDEFPEMEYQAQRIAGWGDNVYVKIPVTNTRGETSVPLIRRLNHLGVKLNVTAVFTLQQVWDICQALAGKTAGVISVFAGRIADAGIDPVPLMAAAREMVAAFPTSSCSGPARASCSTSSRPTRSIVTSSRWRMTCSASSIAWARTCTSSRWRRCRCFARTRLRAGFSLPRPEIRRAA